MEQKRQPPDFRTQEEEFLSVSTLRFKKGDLIMKEGDYGVSMYRILSGRVKVYTEAEGAETLVATLGQGDLMGEMVFLSGGSRKRSASARAVEDCELELMHPKMLEREYEQMPALVKLITDQSIARLRKMNRLVAHLSNKKREKAGRLQEEKRAHYRKKTRMLTTLQPIGSPPQAHMEGEIKDIGLGGVCVEIRPRSVSRFAYKPGAEFRLLSSLPGNKPLSFTARLVWTKDGPIQGNLFLGMNFTEVAAGDRKNLGFFMMAA
jgi:CRP-like cAMP-binding protein